MSPTPSHPLRYSVRPSTNEPVVYCFEDHDPAEKQKYGVSMLYHRGVFVTVNDAHYAIILCRALNNADEEERAKTE